MEAPSVVGLVAGFAVFLFPGYAWTAALAPRLPVAKAVPVGIVLAFTLAPMVMFVLNVLFNAPILPGTLAFLAVALGIAGLAVRLAPRLLDTYVKA